MEWSDARSLAAFSPLVLSLREDNHHRAINPGPSFGGGRPVRLIRAAKTKGHIPLYTSYICMLCYRLFFIIVLQTLC
jgi:hypothetical protein